MTLPDRKFVVCGQFITTCKAQKRHGRCKKQLDIRLVWDSRCPPKDAQKLNSICFWAWFILVTFPISIEKESTNLCLMQPIEKKMTYSIAPHDTEVVIWPLLFVKAVVFHRDAIPTRLGLDNQTRFTGPRNVAKSGLARQKCLRLSLCFWEGI